MLGPKFKINDLDLMYFQFLHKFILSYDYLRNLNVCGIEVVFVDISAFVFVTITIITLKSVMFVSIYIFTQCEHPDNENILHLE